MRTVEIITPENVGVTYTIAGPGSRFVALLLDTVLRLLGTIVLAAAAIAVFSLPRPWSQRMSPWVLAVLIAALGLVWEGYMILFELLWNGQTPGKRLAGLRVLCDGGLPVDFRVVLLRNVLRVVDTLPMPGSYALGGLCAMLNPHGKRLGDMVAGTVVVAEPRATPVASSTQTAEAAQETAEPPAEPEHVTLDWALLNLDRLDAGDWQVINAYLERRPELDAHTAARIAARIAVPLLQRLEVAPDQVGGRFQAFLVGLTAEYRRRLGEPI